MGITVNRDTFTDESLAATIQEVFENPTYLSVARKVSAAIQDTKRTPTQECADWIEFAANHDNAMFLQVPALYMNWFSRNNVDVYAFLLAFNALLGFLILKGCKRCFCKKAASVDAKKKN
jgi:hypothetical protein